MENNEIETMINHIIDGEYDKANNAFGDLVGAKMNDSIEQEKIAVAQQIFNSIDDENSSDLEDEEFDFTDEELEEIDQELELEDEDV